VFHQPPTEQECIDAVRKQFYSGEGAIQYAPEAIARANADLLNTPNKRQKFIDLYCQSTEQAKDYLRQLLMERCTGSNQVS
jgi:ribonucleotide reductase class II